MLQAGRRVVGSNVDMGLIYKNAQRINIHKDVNNSNDKKKSEVDPVKVTTAGGDVLLGKTVTKWFL